MFSRLALIAIVLLAIHSEAVLAGEATTSALPPLRRVRNNFDAIAKKDIPVWGTGEEENDWATLSSLCSQLFERRDFSRLFSCVDVIEKWQTKLGYEPTKSTGLWTKIPPQSYASVLLIEAKAYLESGQYSRAAALAKRSIAEEVRVHRELTNECKAEDSRPCGFHGSLEANLVAASALFQEGNRDESARFQQIVEELCKNTSVFNKQLNASLLATRVRLYLATERFDDAVKLISEDSFKAEELVSGTTIGLGILTIALGLATNASDIRGAVDLTRNAIQEHQSDAHSIPSKFQLAHLRLLARQTADAKKLLDELLASPGVKTFSGIYWAVLYDRGRIAETEGKLDRAVRYYTTAIDEIELQRSTINQEGARIGFFGDKQAVYQALVRLLVQTGRVELAFLATERSKSRALVDMLASKNDFHVASTDEHRIRQLISQQRNTDSLSIFSEEIPAEAIDKQRAANSKELPKSNIKGAGYTETTAAETYIRNLKLDATQNMAALPPELASLVSVTRISLSEIRQNIPPNETILSYYYDKVNLYAFVLDQQSLKIVKLEREHLEEDVEAVRDAIHHLNDKYLDKAGALYSRLIVPLKAHINTAKLIVAPHGVLHYLPFAALFDGKDYLIDHFQLAFLPSVSSIKFIGKNRTESKVGTLMALGNPDLGNPSYDLPAAEKEAQSIASIFANSLVLVRDQASKKALREYGAGFKYLHFAMHGKLDPGNPLRSALMLASKSQTNENDQLTVGELYSMKLGADMVTLSACQTGLGKISNGDDMVGLVRGFMYAGVNQIVSTLWEIDDEATEKLMVSFYRDVSAGKSKPGSLRNAQMKLRRDYPQPKYWAAFQITGGTKQE